MQSDDDPDYGPGDPGPPCKRHKCAAGDQESVEDDQEPVEQGLYCSQQKPILDPSTLRWTMGGIECGVECSLREDQCGAFLKLMAKLGTSPSNTVIGVGGCGKGKSLVIGALMCQSQCEGAKSVLVVVPSGITDRIKTMVTQNVDCSNLRIHIVTEMAHITKMTDSVLNEVHEDARHVTIISLTLLSALSDMKYRKFLDKLIEVFAIIPCDRFIADECQSLFNSNGLYHVITEMVYNNSSGEDQRVFFSATPINSCDIARYEPMKAATRNQSVTRSTNSVMRMIVEHGIQLFPGPPKVYDVLHVTAGYVHPQTLCAPLNIVRTNGRNEHSVTQHCVYYPNVQLNTKNTKKNINKDVTNVTAEEEGIVVPDNPKLKFLKTLFVEYFERSAFKSSQNGSVCDRARGGMFLLEAVSVALAVYTMICREALDIVQGNSDVTRAILPVYICLVTGGKCTVTTQDGLVRDMTLGVMKQFLAELTVSETGFVCIFVGTVMVTEAGSFDAPDMDFIVFFPLDRMPVQSFGRTARGPKSTLPLILTVENTTAVPDTRGLGRAYQNANGISSFQQQPPETPGVFNLNDMKALVRYMLGERDVNPPNVSVGRFICPDYKLEEC